MGVGIVRFAQGLYFRLGDLKLAGLHTRYTSVSIGGSGNAEVFASERLDGDIDGSGNIRYAGNPKQIGRTVMGTGSIEPM